MRASKRGFTLIELAVSIAVMSTLIALLLPGVQSARESARRSDCQNRLKQWGLALHNYHDAHSVLPPGSISRSPALSPFSGWGWQAMVLPQMEQSSLYAQCDFSMHTAHGPNRNLIGRPVPSTHCPSDVADEALMVDLPTHGLIRLATGNYAGSVGVLSGLSNTRFAHITDGLSQTLLVGERNVHPGTDGTIPFMSSWCGILSENNVFISSSAPYAYATAVRLINSSSTSSLVFSSRHPMGANFTLADGSVRFIPASIDAQVYEALGTPAGNETISF